MQCNIMVFIMEWRGRERWRGEKEREGREEEEGEEGREGGCIVVEKKGERVLHFGKEVWCTVYYNFQCLSLSCLSHDINCLEATRVLILELLAMEGNYEEAAIRISDLIQLLDRFEPKNHTLYHDMALAFARLVSRLTYSYASMHVFSL